MEDFDFDDDIVGGGCGGGGGNGGGGGEFADDDDDSGRFDGGFSGPVPPAKRRQLGLAECMRAAWPGYFQDSMAESGNEVNTVQELCDRLRGHWSPLLGDRGRKVGGAWRRLNVKRRRDVPIDLGLMRHLDESKRLADITAKFVQPSEGMGASAPRAPASMASQASSASSSNVSSSSASGDVKNFNFEHSLVNNPRWTKCCFDLAVATIFSQHANVLDWAGRQSVKCRFFNLASLCAIKKVKANAVGRFVAIRGNVVRASNVRPKPQSIGFHCITCGTTFEQRLQDGRYVVPTKCQTDHEDECKGRKFEAIRGDAETLDFQQIKLQEMGGRGLDAGRIPRTIQIELEDTLCNTCVPGDVVTVCGEIRAVRTDELEGRRVFEKKSTYLLYMEAHSIVQAGQRKRRRQRRRENGGGGVDNNFNADSANEDAEGNNDDQPSAGTDKIDSSSFSEKDIFNIANVSLFNNHKPFDLLVASLCPAIVGNHLVKAGLLLALFGGTSSRKMDEKNRVPVRGDLHVLVVGDPGLGKSQMLKACCAAAPRGVYVTGGTTTTTGLTVTMVRDPVTKDFALEAGALVLGDQGICCIDEFDKMGAEHQALLEAMEQQSISVAKAGIVCTLSARTSILAAANPIGGHYDRSKTVSENLKMSDPLLSRFDIIYILLDKPDKSRDEMLSAHIMGLHNDDGSSRAASRFTQGDFGADPAAAVDGGGGALRDRLQAAAIKEKDDLLPTRLLQKYIAYARRWVSPRLSTGAARRLRRFYLQLRSKVQEDDSTPITMRQLEALVRLAQARAKADLRSVVTVGDADDVVQIMEDALCDIADNGDRTCSFGKITGCSAATLVKKAAALLSQKATQKRSPMFSTGEIEDAFRKGRIMSQVLNRPGGFRGFLELLNEQMYLNKKGPGLWAVGHTHYSSNRSSQRGGGRQYS